MNLKEVIDAAPPTPACFPDRVQWAAYLLQCQEFGKRQSARPFANGIYRPAFNFCEDCLREHAYAMRKKDRCSPDQFRGIPIKEVACS